MAFKKRTVCLDFDGVVHYYAGNWEGAHIISGPPVFGAIEFMLGALKHFDVAIFSSRSNQEGGIAAMQEWLRSHAASTDWYASQTGPGLESVRFPTEKPPAQVYIDDRAICFDGTWPEMEAIRNFRPWNKRKEGEF